MENAEQIVEFNLGDRKLLHASFGMLIALVVFTFVVLSLLLVYSQKKTNCDGTRVVLRETPVPPSTGGVRLSSSVSPGMSAELESRKTTTVGGVATPKPKAGGVEDYTRAQVHERLSAPTSENKRGFFPRYLLNPDHTQQYGHRNGQGHAPGHGQGHGQGHAPGHGQGHAPGHGQGHAPGHGQGHAPGHGQGHAPGHGQGHAPGHGQGHAPGHGQGHAPGHGQGHGREVQVRAEMYKNHHAHPDAFLPFSVTQQPTHDDSRNPVQNAHYRLQVPSSAHASLHDPNRGYEGPSNDDEGLLPLPQVGEHASGDVGFTPLG